MPSPSPGMNPYLEQDEVWHDFHESFLPLAGDLLNVQLGDRYIAKTVEHVYLHDLSTEQRAFLGRGDVTVSGLSPEVGAAAGATVIEAPVQVELPMFDGERECFLEIRDRRNRQLITVLELLSPSNKKPGPDREQYINKRNQLLMTGVTLVEIDLLRAGPRMPFVNLPSCDYYAMVSRSGQWPVAARRPLAAAVARSAAADPHPSTRAERRPAPGFAADVAPYL